MYIYFNAQKVFQEISLKEDLNLDSKIESLNIASK